MRVPMIIGAAALATLLAASLAGSSEAHAQDGCDPAYPDICVPSPPPDLQCSDIVYEDFMVLPPDPHGFDQDGDGYGCDGDSPPTPTEQPTALPDPTVAPEPTEDESDVAGASDPAPPSAGFGPGSAEGPLVLSWFVAGLVGAGLAWLSAGLLAARLRTVTAGEPAAPQQDVSTASARRRLGGAPPLVKPGRFRRRTR